jgi:hypothetical protein
VGWYPWSRGMTYFRPIADHGECGFVCMFLFAAVAWWGFALAVGALAWLGIAFVLKLVGRKRVPRELTISSE